ncbi:serine/threonine protein kinase [Singulisphaera sp. GP187]|uniref:serine/threonine-protein kinase n=1 Tax=Singulisphaera sp. GP187 TaxID=1882752 RepID=UPI000926FA33|nr:serine/threonine-protein kinase [Singulisphaera sp. GP187]SIO63144.1 serine/threonine protein kinase [Singulisphaera sp. GP187]
MATFEKPKPSESIPLNLLPVIQSAGVLTDRQFQDVKAKVLSGEYPNESRALAARLVHDNVLTAYQTKRFLSNKSHGMVVGRYAILDRLGSGSMGRVYKAHHLMMDRVVALKIIAPEIATNERVVARFYREMKLVGRLDHPNVVRAYDADQLNKILYIVMEYVRGQSLAQLFRKAPIAPPDMVNYAAQAALGLAHAHEQGIVHRDVKPSNLLLTDDLKIKVLDLGLGVLMEADDQSSFATADGIAVGTVDYMSPEQACGRDVDGRSDLFSLGCSMYHMMTGRLPYPGENPIERLGKRISGRPVPLTEVQPNLPAGLVKVVDKLLAYKPSERFQTATEASEALLALIRPRTKRVAPPPEREPAPAPAPASPAVVVTPPPVAAPPAVITVRPNYPTWFQPLASFAEQKPRAALCAALGTLAVTFACGFGIALLVR